MAKEGFSECAASVAADTNAGVDVLETLLDIGYDPAHHFDRKPSDGNQEPAASRKAFDRGISYLERIRLEIRLKQTQGDCRGAVETLGDALHTLQDFFAHSNFVDGLSSAEQGQALLALEDTTQDPPASLRIACWDGFAADISNNDNDPTTPPYSHHDYNKDEPGRPYFAQAMAQAVTATRSFAPNWPLGCKQSDLCGGDDKETKGITSGDPNDKSGPSGFGAARWAASSQPLTYMIEFENKPTFAPAYEIVVNDKLDAVNFDITTLSLVLQLEK